MRKVLGFLGVVFLIVVAGLFYSSDTAIYECTGMMTKASEKSPYPTTLFIKVTTKRWWTFWEPRDGALQWEAQVPDDDPAKVIKTDFFQIKRVGYLGSYLSLYHYKAGETVDMTKPPQGYFSTLSNYLTLKISDDVTFNGSCKPKND